MKSQKTVGYCRVSTLEQKKNGYGIDIQVREIKKFAKDHDLKIDYIFKDEAVSGTEEDREQLGILRNLCKRGKIKAVIFPSTDRMARSVRISENLIYELNLLKVRLYFVDMPFSNPDNPGYIENMLRQIKEVIAESNRNAIIERLKKGREERVRKGLPSGGNVPYGYRRKNKQLQIVLKESHIINTIYNLANTGLKSQNIADYLNYQGFRRRNKKEWTQKMVWSILHRKELYRHGIVRYGEITGENKKLVILDK